MRDAYGRNLFGQGCLLARRLVERGVPFVEVTLERLGHARPERRHRAKPEPNGGHGLGGADATT